MDERKLWVFKSVSDEDRSYRSIGGYNDELATKYVYDNFVANHKQVKKGDRAIIINKESILGFVRIEDIKTEPTTKKRGRCPVCGVTNFEARKNKVPVYRCNKGHEFEKISEETVPATSYIANYGASYIKPYKDLSISSLRPYYINTYNRNMSIQLLSPDFFDSHFKNIPAMLEGRNSYLLPTEAVDLVMEPEPNDDYSPRPDDERKKISRQIKERRGQKKFRDSIRSRYGDQCMITGCELLDILEAAHIKPYRGENDNHPSNGLLLRADIHTLFDLNLIGIHPISLKIHVHPSALTNGYAQYENCKLLGCTETKKPNQEALQFRWEEFTQNEE